MFPRLFLLLPLLSTATLAGEQVLVPTGTTWRFLDNGSNQGTAWRGLGFDDSSWVSGAAQLGYGDGDEATLVGFGPSASAKYITTWFRTSFDVASPSAFTSLELRLLADDGAVAYLNGVEVARDNMTEAAFGYLTLAYSGIDGLEEDLFYAHPVDAALLVTGTNVLAVEVHQRDASSSDISLEAELVGYDQPTMLRGPYLQRTTASEVTVRWRTDVPTPTHLEYGPAPGPLSISVDDPLPVTEHEVRITGLAADSVYGYAVGDGGALSVGRDANHRFTTAPTTGLDRPFRVWVLGDSGTADTNAEAVRDAYLGWGGTTPTDLVLMLGDNAYVKGADYEYQAAVFDMYGEILRHSPLFATRGNHDVSANVYYGNFSFPSAGEAGGVASLSEAYYSFDWANVHFVCLDSEGTPKSPTGAMATWLQADLAATDQDWIIAYWHHAPYTAGSHDSDVEVGLVDMRTSIVPLLEAGGVDLVLCGHSHSYERSHLIDGHYGTSDTYAPAAHELDPGSGDPQTDGPFFKAVAPNAGTVYAVAGSSGKISDGPLDHPAMVVSTKTLGSVVLDVDGGRLDVSFVSSTGAVLDSFRMRTYPDEGLVADTTTLSLGAGGTQSFTIAAGPAHAGELYFLLGSFAGDEPGLVLDGKLLPLNLDGFMLQGLLQPNSPALQATLGVLDATGRAFPSLVLPPTLGPSLIGATAHHAGLALDAASGQVSFTSGAFPTTLLP